MIRDRQVLQSPRPRPFDHFFERCLSVGSPGVRVQITLDVGKLQQIRQSSALRPRKLKSGFPHLGRMAQSYRAHFGESPSETLARDWS